MGLHTLTFDISTKVCWPTFQKMTTKWYMWHSLLQGTEYQSMFKEHQSSCCFKGTTHVSPAHKLFIFKLKRNKSSCIGPIWNCRWQAHTGQLLVSHGKFHQGPTRRQTGITGILCGMHTSVHSDRTHNIQMSTYPTKSRQ